MMRQRRLDSSFRKLSACLTMFPPFAPRIEELLSRVVELAVVFLFVCLSTQTESYISFTQIVIRKCYFCL